MTDKYRKAVRKMYPRAVWVTGAGRYALLAHCGGALTITLWIDLEQAKKRKRLIDRCGCGGRCSMHHEILDMEQGAVAVDA